MAQRRRPTRASRRDDDYDEDDGRQRYSRNQAPNMAPVVAVIAVIAMGGIAFAVYSNSSKKDAAANEKAPAEVVDPFANVPKEEGPTGLSPGGKRTGVVSRSPEGLLQDPEWTGFVSRANEAIALHNTAQAALKAGDDGTYRNKGLDAKEKMNAVLEDMWYFYSGLIDEYGEDDRRVRQITAERDKWFKVAGKYKGLSRD